MNFKRILITGAICALLLSCQAGLRAAETVSRYTPTTGAAAKIKIDAAVEAPFRVPRTVYGTFLEDIRSSVFGGVSAEILDNPSLEPYPASLQTLQERFSAKEFLGASRIGLPIPWLPLRSDDGWRYEPRRGNAANSIQYLYVMGIAGREVGIRQGVYLPIERELRYHGVLFAISDKDETALDVSFRAHGDPERVLASDRLTVPAGSNWHKLSFRLELPSGAVKALEQVDFVVAINGGQRISLDEIRLYPDDAVDGLDPEVIQLSKDLHSPLLRYGGNFTSGYHWRDGVGPVDQRPTMLNQSWGIPEYNEFGTDELMKFCELIGSQPQICLNLGSGTPEEAREWVEYCQGSGETKGGALRKANGHPEPYPVTAWELGNELWGHFQIGWQTPEGNAERYRAFYDAIKDLVPSSTMIFANGADIDFHKEWNGALLKDDPSRLTFLTTHMVIGMEQLVNKQADRDAMLAADFSVPQGVADGLERMREQIDANPATRGKVKIAFTEWLFIPREEDVHLPRFDNQGGAVLGAAWMNMILSHADFVPVSDMTGLIDFAGIHKAKGRTFGTPQFWAFSLYSNYAGDELLGSNTTVRLYDVHQGLRRMPEVKNVPYLDVLATRHSSDGRVALFVVNRDWKNPIATDISLDHFTPAGDVEVHTLQAAELTSMNDPEHPNLVRPVDSKLQISGNSFRHTFAPLSVTVFVFQPK